VHTLRGRLRLLTVGLAIAFGLAGVVAVARLRVLEGAVTAVLSRNYRSIEAASAMVQGISALQLAVRDRRCPAVCPGLRDDFRHALRVEHDNYTEPGEPELAHRIDAGATAMFAAAERGAPVAEIDQIAGPLRADLDALVALNEHAMFAADRRTRSVSNNLLLGVLASLVLLTAVVTAAGWAIASAFARNVDALLDGEARMRGVLESSEDGLVVLDPDGTVRDANEVATAIVGLERGQVVGRRLDDLATRAPHYLRIREAARSLFERPESDGERVELTLFLRGRDHHYVLRPTRLRARDGSPAGLVLALQDVTHLRDQEARREQLVATLSHELRSPLTSLRMAVELLARPEHAPDVVPRELLATAGEDVQRLGDLADRLLDVSRDRGASIALERRSVDVADVVQRATRLFALQAQEKGVTLECQAAAPGLTIAGDPTKLTWAISNLLSNALRYTPSGGCVRVAARAGDGTVAVSVADTGPGIPEEQRARIFERFAQAADGGEAGAAGLGLAIVRDIVQAHGGRIRLESRVGEGSRFLLELPRS
jgi:PAS domain S-box-containing protein